MHQGGLLLAGFANPVRYLFDQELAERASSLQVRYRLPHSDAESLTDQQKQQYIEGGEPFEWSHTLEDRIEGQLEGGFVIMGLYEDSYGGSADDLLSRYMPSFIATRAIKPQKEEGL